MLAYLRMEHQFKCKMLSKHVLICMIYNVDIYEHMKSRFCHSNPIQSWLNLCNGQLLN